MEALQRKLSRGNSGNGASVWSRRTLKRSQTAPTPAAPPQDEPMSSSEDERPAHSIVPDPMSVSYDAWASVPLPAPKLYYPLHNPVGPRFYRNFHLIPPSQIRPGARPPSVFSPSFPPISTQTSQDHLDSGPSRTPSHSTLLPTPSSSQTAVGDGPKGRSRKTSQSTPDNVDLMDVTDPWGTNWHHTSPYDIGMPGGSASVDHDNSRRPRRASMTAAQNGYKTTSKSPLSQSTSAVHLQSEMPPIHTPRKLSKRQKPPPQQQQPAGPSSAKDKESEDPQEQVPATHPVEPNPSLPQRMSVAPPLGQDSTLASRPSLKKEKRGSVLGRLARKLSNMRRSFDGYGKQRSEDDWHQITPPGTRSSTNLNTPEPINPDTNQERVSVKRVPPPAVHDSPTVSIPQQSDPSPRDDSASSISVEAPFSIGKLTIANPDIPLADSSTPNGLNPLLPPDKPQELPQSPVSPGLPIGNLLSPLPKSVQIPSPPPTPGPPIPAKDGAPSQRPVSQRPPSALRPTEYPPSLSPLSPILQSPSGGLSDSHTTPRPAERPLQPDQTPISPAPTPSPVSPVPTSPTTTKRVSTRYSTAPSQPSQPSARPPSTVESIASSIVSATTATSYVPFPNTNANVYQPSSTQDGGFLSTAAAAAADRSSYLSYADSPFSNASVLANPPTPYTNDTARLYMLATPEPSPHVPIPTTTAAPKPPAKPSSSPLVQSPIASSSTPPPQQITPENSSHSRSQPNSNNTRGQSQGKRTTVTSSVNRDSTSIRQSTSGGGGGGGGNGGATGSRQTESSKLMKSESGHARAASGEQQWDVVEKQEREKRRESRRERDRDSKEREREREREREKRESRNHQDDRRKSHRNTTLKTSSPEPPPAATAAATAAANGRPPSHHGHHKESSSSRQEESVRREREEQARRERERDEQMRREREREKEEQARREREREKEEQVRREREDQARREERARREWEERMRREREEQARREWEEQARREREEQVRREREEQARREKEEQARREREEQTRKEERLRKEWEDQVKKEKDEQRRRDREKEKEREREREKEKEKERKEREREERKAREREERKKEEKKKIREEKERRSKDEHKSKEHRSNEEQKVKESETKRRSKDDRQHKSRDEKSSRRREKERERESRGPKPDLNKPQPPPPPPASDESSSTDAPHTHLNRQPSASTRPTSELPCAADLNALRAKEAWDMERLWKARSMYGTEADGAPVAPPGDPMVNGSTNSIPFDAQVAMRMGMNLGPSTNGMYGSSHTAFVVQNSFHHNQQPAFGIYRQPPGTAGSGYWPSPPTIPSLHDSITSYDIPTPDPLRMGPYRYGGYGGSSPGLLGPVSSPPVVVASGVEKDMPLANPLPEPPRESTYEPTPLSSDYWNTHTGLTTA